MSTYIEYIVYIQRENSFQQSCEIVKLHNFILIACNLPWKNKVVFFHHIMKESKKG
jgi:uncharacterized protein (DUF1919 family)